MSWWYNKLPKMTAASVCVLEGVLAASRLFRRLSKISKWVHSRFLSNSCLCPGSQACEILCEPFKSASLVAETVKNLPAIWETQVRFPDWEDPLEKEMATYYSILAWEIPWTEEPAGLQPVGWQEVRHY